MSHGFGGLPEDGDYLTNGASANLLISTERDRQAINGMPRMSGIPVNIRPTNGPQAEAAPPYRTSRLSGSALTAARISATSGMVATRKSAVSGKRLPGRLEIRGPRLHN